MRLIPGKTKVSVELFRGVTLGDIIVCGVAMGMLILVLVSNLPWKLGICITIAIIVALLLLRLDEQPNYMYLLHILSFFGYDRRFGRTLNDKLLVEAGEGTLKDVAFDVVFKDRPESLEELEETKKLTKGEQRAQLRARKAAVTADSVFLESALRVRPDLTVVRAEEAALLSTDADLYILGTSPLIVTRTLPEEGYDPSAQGFEPFSWAETETEVTGSPSPKISDSPLSAGLPLKNVFFRSIRPVTGGKAAVTLEENPGVAYADGMVVLGFDLHNSNLPLKYDFPVLIQNILDWMLPEETEDGPETEDPMPVAESDVRMVTPDDISGTPRAENEQGRELTGILLMVFLVLMLVEMGMRLGIAVPAHRKVNRNVN